MTDYIYEEETSPFSGWMSIMDFARAAKVKPNTVYQWIARGKVESELVDNMHMVNPNSLLNVPRQTYDNDKKEPMTISVTSALQDRLRKHAISDNASYTIEFSVWLLYAILGIIPEDKIVKRLVDAAMRFQIPRREVHATLWRIAQAVMNYED